MLVEECGAREFWRDDFVQCAENVTSFYNVGFDGKLRQDATGKLSVSCYEEDTTPERLDMIRKAEERLMGLFNTLQ